MTDQNPIKEAAEWGARTLGNPIIDATIPDIQTSFDLEAVYGKLVRRVEAQCWADVLTVAAGPTSWAGALEDVRNTVTRDLTMSPVANSTGVGHRAFDQARIEGWARFLQNSAAVGS